MPHPTTPTVLTRAELRRSQRPEWFTATDRAGLAGALRLALGALGMLCLAVLLVVLPPGQRIDDLASHDIGIGWPEIWEVNRRLAYVTPTLVAVVGLVTAALAVLRRRLDLAAASALILAGANVTTRLVKAFVPRPANGIGDALFGPDNTMPSGHTTAMMSFAGALVLVAPPVLRVAAAAVGTGLVTFGGIGMLCVDAHRPSDILAGVGVGVGWTAVGVAVVIAARAVARRRFPRYFATHATPLAASRPVSRRADAVALASVGGSALVVIAWIVSVGVRFGPGVAGKVVGLGAIGCTAAMICLAVWWAARLCTRYLP